MDIVNPIKSYCATGFMTFNGNPITALFLDVVVPAMFPVVEKPMLSLHVTEHAHAVITAIVCVGSQLETQLK